MLTFLNFSRKINEEGVPTNTAGNGEVAGLGVGSQGEPPINKKTLLIKRKKLDVGRN